MIENDMECSSSIPIESLIFARKWGAPAMEGSRLLDEFGSLSTTFDDSRNDNLIASPSRGTRSPRGPFVGTVRPSSSTLS
eukprot:CAMPEP_0184686740 /NCGR_PEP_ID=MMETSP0312-20130426/23823_1 /TAXON_ID=31354 /ORGANISM="Compsopogon coeruleus, Strain SAG 36.94" /LENGTH=79 /DNA_ID=CAMNT_0027142175 /DNA_START=659 /DNA_END=895 /DNA_ORIENTATION=+